MIFVQNICLKFVYYYICIKIYSENNISEIIYFNLVHNAKLLAQTERRGLRVANRYCSVSIEMHLSKEAAWFFH